MPNSFADDILDRLFKDENRQPIREPLVRSEGYGYAYDDWELKGHASLAYSSLKEQLVLNLSTSDLDCLRFVDGQSHGFFVRAGAWMNHPQELDFLLDDLASKLKEWHYLEQMSERVSTVRNEKVEVFNRRYLKPSFRKPIGLRNYGNVMLETIEKDGKPWGLKCTATTYPGRNEAEFFSFEALLERLFKG